MAPGLYAYDPTLHELITVGEPGPGLDRLLADAAAAANVEAPPQILLVLAARYARTQRVYGDLSYSLILKEVGAVFQAAMMAAAAMGLGTCPLGCGNSLLFSELIGVNPADRDLGGRDDGRFARGDRVRESGVLPRTRDRYTPVDTRVAPLQ